MESVQKIRKFDGMVFRKFEIWLQVFEKLQIWRKCSENLWNLKKSVRKIANLKKIYKTHIIQFPLREDCSYFIPVENLGNVSNTGRDGI